MDNVIVTPHIAGSLDGECARMGRWMVDELRRYLAGQELLGRTFREALPGNGYVAAASVKFA
jgi:phosphoglycerate dehydrogenase-like enzyme